MQFGTAWYKNCQRRKWHSSRIPRGRQFAAKPLTRSFGDLSFSERMPPKRTRLDRFLARLLGRLKILDGCTYHGLRITRRAAIVLVALMSLIKFGPSKLGTTANKPSEQLP